MIPDAGGFVAGAIAVNPVLERHGEWVKQNPLYIWRYASTPKVTRMQAASLLRVSPYAIYTWESGSSRPNEESMDRLSGLLGYSARTAWDTWEAQRA
jgi:hypothetical protein